MSDIARARAILRRGLDGDDRFLRYTVHLALALMNREIPEFKTEKKLPPLTRTQVEWAKQLRQQRLPMNEIARIIGTNIGRVSEAVNGLREGVG